MSSRRPLSQKQLQDIADNLSDLSDLDDPYSSDDSQADPDFTSYANDSEPDENINDADELDNGSDSDEVNSDKEESDDEQSDVEEEGELVRNDPPFLWTVCTESFTPKFLIPQEEKCTIMADLNRGSSPVECFLKLFPTSLLLQISHYTNKRIDILEKTKKRPYQRTCSGELMIILGCTIIMTYNRVPTIQMYWSRNKSLGNIAIKEAISRDRFLLLTSKLYFNDPEKPDNASKIYYIEEVLSCLKMTFQKSRSDSTFQSIDESITKFKGRSTLKQYLPLKPVKRGIKLWTRSDSATGYVYDTNVYCGKDDARAEGTLGERVVLKLAETIKKQHVALCCDRFFTSVNLLNTINFPTFGTVISRRVNLPQLNAKLDRGQSEMACCKEGLLGVKWQDTKEVFAISNCHKANLSTTQRKLKDGTKKTVDCPEVMVDYNRFMGGVDLTDQMVTMYELDRRSAKWWRKVFYRLFTTAIYNSYIIYRELRLLDNFAFLDYLVEVAEGLIALGRSKVPNTRKRSRRVGRRSKKSKTSH